MTSQPCTLFHVSDLHFGAEDAAALVRLAAAGADAVLSGHVHDPFDRTHDAGGRAIRLIGAGTLSERLRDTPPSYNRLEWSASTGLKLEVRRLAS